MRMRRELLDVFEAGEAGILEDAGIAPRAFADPGGIHLFAVHFCDEAPQRARVTLGKRAQLPTNARLADRADLVYGDLDIPLADSDGEPGAPGRVQLRRERTDGDGLDTFVERVE